MRKPTDPPEWRLWDTIYWAVMGPALVFVLLGSAGCFESEVIAGEPTVHPERYRQLYFDIDEMTGCHYLMTLEGHFAPRLDADGNHICTEVPE